MSNAFIFPSDLLSAVKLFAPRTSERPQQVSVQFEVRANEVRAIASDDFMLACARTDNGDRALPGHYTVPLALLSHVKASDKLCTVITVMENQVKVYADGQTVTGPLMERKPIPYRDTFPERVENIHPGQFNLEFLVTAHRAAKILRRKTVQILHNDDRHAAVLDFQHPDFTAIIMPFRPVQPVDFSWIHH